MKKNLLVLILFTMVALPGHCELTTDEALSPEYIINHGHSPEMARLMDLQNSQINNVPTVYVEKKSPRWYKSHITNEKVKNVLLHLDPQEEQGKYTKAIFDYFDPGLDDGKFMQNQIHYGNGPEDL